MQHLFLIRKGVESLGNFAISSSAICRNSSGSMLFLRIAFIRNRMGACSTFIFRLLTSRTIK